MSHGFLPINVTSYMSSTKRIPIGGTVRWKPVFGIKLHVIWVYYNKWDILHVINEEGGR
jgi:hypothetical protein